MVDHSLTLHAAIIKNIHHDNYNVCIALAPPHRGISTRGAFIIQVALLALISYNIE